MKRAFQQMTVCVLSVLICALFSGCTIGEYHVFDTYLDENGEQHFMGFGRTGPSGGEDVIKDENPIEEVDPLREKASNGDLESIVGTKLKRGWTSDEHSILKGENVSVREDSILFSVELKREKEVVISCDIVPEKGEYQLVYADPEGRERVLQNGEVFQSEEKLLFPQGQNDIFILSNSAVFKEIDIAIMGIEASDFE